MIVLYTWGTPNGRKPLIMLEETGLDYRIAPIDIGNQGQFQPAFLAISPNNKIPAIVDEDARGGSQAVFESGAVLTYLAEKSGALLAKDGEERWAAIGWLHWQIGGLGPMLGQLSYFAMRADEKMPLAIDRFMIESQRLFSVLEHRLTLEEYLAGGEYSVADVAIFPWIKAAHDQMAPVLQDVLTASPAIRRWLKTVGDRPAVQRAMAIAIP